jgi:ribosomal protein L21
VVYAVVRAGGRQEKVEVGTIVTMDRIKADNDGNVQLIPVCPHSFLAVTTLLPAGVPRSDIPIN